MTTLHIPGYPRMGARRELKFALERHWRGDLTEQGLEQVARELRFRHWQQQRDAGLTWVTVGDFAFYDHVLDHVELLGCAPGRFAFRGDEGSLERQFAMARGTEREPALEMTKWFDTNYHYLVPELRPDTVFTENPARLLGQVREAREAGHPVKVVLVGPLTFLWLSKSQTSGFACLDLCDALAATYARILGRLSAAGVAWVQLDEPVLALELPDEWRSRFQAVYEALATGGPNILLASCFGGLGGNLEIVRQLPVQGLHVDATRAPDELLEVARALPPGAVLSAGVVDGRNVWRTDPDRVLAQILPLRQRLGARLWLSTSCSLLHVPLDLELETDLDPELYGWLAFARQKLDELRVLGRVLEHGEDCEARALEAARRAAQARRESARVRDAAVRSRVAALDALADRRCAPYVQRHAAQRARLDLPCLPTTHHRQLPPDTRDPLHPGGPSRRASDGCPVPGLSADGDHPRDPPAGIAGAGCAGARRTRAQRHGAVFRRAAERRADHPERLGAANPGTVYLLCFSLDLPYLWAPEQWLHCPQDPTRNRKPGQRAISANISSHCSLTPEGGLGHP